MPDLVIPFEPRALMSLLGIVTLVLEVWKVDRNWDEEGEKAYVGAAKESKSNTAVVIPPKDLEAAFIFPTAFLVGWVLYAVANLIAVTGYSLNLLGNTAFAAAAS